MWAILKRNRTYRYLWLGMTTSRAGDILFDLAILFTAYQQYHSARVIAGIVVAQALPWMLLSPASGFIADRRNRKAILIGMDILRAVFVVLLAFHQSLVIMYAVCFVLETASTTYSSARSAVMPELVGSDLPEAVSVSQVTLQWLNVLTPFISGVLLVAIGLRWPFLLDAATFLISAALTWPIAIPTVTPLCAGLDLSDARDGHDSWYAGVQFLLTHSWPLFLVLFALGYYFSNSLLNIMTVVIVGETITASPLLYAIIVGAQAVGTYLAALAIQKILHCSREQRTKIILAGGAIGGMALLFLPFAAGTFILMFIAWLIYGAGEGGREISSNASFAAAIPQKMRGRVYGVANGLLNISPLLAAVLSSTIGSTAQWRDIYYVDGAILIIMSGLAWCWIKTFGYRSMYFEEDTTSLTI